jgi:hypothetical protein
MNLQNVYWCFLCELKAQALYFEKYHESMEKVVRIIRIFIAVVSSGGSIISLIGAMISHVSPSLWIVVMIILQLAWLIKDHFPYENRRKFTNELRYLFKDIFVRAEKEWYYISRGLSYEEINDLLYNIKKEINIMEKGFVSDSTLPLKNKLQFEAQRKTEQYFKRYLLEN